MTFLISSLQGDSGTDGRVSDFVEGGRMALDNKTSLLNTPLLSSSPRGAREHFSDSPFKHSRKDTSMDDSEHPTDGTQTHSDTTTQTHTAPIKTNHAIIVPSACLLSLNRQQPRPIGAGGRAAERAVQSQRAHWGEEDSAARPAEADSREHPAGVGRTFQDHPAAAAGNDGRQRGTHTGCLSVVTLYK